MLEGKVVRRVRPMTAAEMSAEGWDIASWQPPATVIEFEDGTIVFAAQDEEGHRPGALFGVNLMNGAFVLQVTSSVLQ